MIITVGNSKFIAAGKVIRDAEYSTFGAKNYPKTKVVVSAGSKDDPPLYCTAMFAEAEVCRGLKKGDVVSLQGTIKTREYQGKIYTDYEIEYVGIQWPAQSAPATKEESWTPVSTEEVPF